MRYQEDLQVAVRERFRRLMITTFSSAGHEVSLTVDWISSRPALVAILTEAEAVEPDLDFDSFRTTFNDYGTTFTWPSRTEAGRASLIWKLMQRMVADIANGTDSDRIGINYAHGFSRKTNLNDSWRDLTEQILQPLFDYLTEHIAAESSILYVLERYVRRVEWFDRNDLYERAAADTKKTEDVYDAHLRRFLFAEGINMPFTQARSASGESDVLSALDTDDPARLRGQSLRRDQPQEARNRLGLQPSHPVRPGLWQTDRLSSRDQPVWASNVVPHRRQHQSLAATHHGLRRQGVSDWRSSFALPQREPAGQGCPGQHHPRRSGQPGYPRRLVAVSGRAHGGPVVVQIWVQVRRG